jgi:hypothetical protein
MFPGGRAIALSLAAGSGLALCSGLATARAEQHRAASAAKVRPAAAQAVDAARPALNRTTARLKQVQVVFRCGPLGSSRHPEGTTPRAGRRGARHAPKARPLSAAHRAPRGARRAACPPPERAARPPARARAPAQARRAHTADGRRVPTAGRNLGP